MNEAKKQYTTVGRVFSQKLELPIGSPLSLTAKEAKVLGSAVKLDEIQPAPVVEDPAKPPLVDAPPGVKAPAPPAPAVKAEAKS